MVLFLNSTPRISPVGLVALTRLPAMVTVPVVLKASTLVRSTAGYVGKRTGVLSPGKQMLRHI
jgi:hypothetical protein